MDFLDFRKLGELELDFMDSKKARGVRVGDFGPNSTRVRELTLTLF